MHLHSAHEHYTPDDDHGGPEHGHGYEHEQAHRHHGGHHHHAHDHSASRFLPLALVLTLGFALVEAIAGWWSGSLALLGDAGHMLTDAASLGLAALAARVALRPASVRHSWGLRRVEALAALANGLFMLVIVGGLVWHAVERLLEPRAVAGEAVILVALGGLVLNLAVDSWYERTYINWEGDSCTEASASLTLYGWNQRTQQPIRKNASRWVNDDTSAVGGVDQQGSEALDELLGKLQLRKLIFPLQGK